MFFPSSHQSWCIYIGIVQVYGSGLNHVPDIVRKHSRIGSELQNRVREFYGSFFLFDFQRVFFGAGKDRLVGDFLEF